MFKSPSWDGCHFYQAVRSWHNLSLYWPQWTNFAVYKHVIFKSSY
jgi:hypothetical protein